jgi:hypothetical protein
MQGGSANMGRYLYLLFVVLIKVLSGSDILSHEREAGLE